jgi:alpha-amylase
MRSLLSRIPRKLAISLGGGILAVAIAVTSFSLLAPAGAPNKEITSKSVGAQMFMWPWASLKTECTNVLGPEGMDWIMVSPPQEDISGPQWWVHYQPVSYKLDSQLGTEKQFTEMVAACNKAGVQIVVDTVINHMANSSGVGFAGTNFTKYDYKGLYNTGEFHMGLPSSDPNFCDTDIYDYNDPFQNVHCELGSLPDLNTENPNVRSTIAGYMNHLIDLGVAGFRIDAAKHIGIEDLTSIKKQLKQVNGRAPYLLSETIGDVGTNLPFAAIGDVFAWDYQTRFQDMFNYSMYSGMPGYDRASIIGDPNKTVIMVSNHDTEHHGPAAITYLDPLKYQAASAFLLADAYGKPMLYTGYAFADENDGPPAADDGYYKPAVCPKSWSVPSKTYADGSFICMERWNSVKGMIQWHHEVGNAKITNAKNQGQLLSFTRGSGFFAVNADLMKPAKVKLQTKLPAGTYCDVYTGGAKAKKDNGKCVGVTVVVGANGTAQFNIPATAAVAIDAINKSK